jgi:acylglycerol lipase
VSSPSTCAVTENPRESADTATSFDDFLDDSAELTKLVDARAGGKKTFLFGHSFGGLVATATMLRAPGTYAGLLLSGPFFGLALQVPAVKVFAGRIASRVLPKLGLPSGLVGRDLTHDEARAAAYDADPLVFKQAKARWFTEAQKAQEDVLARAGTLSVPLYEMFGMNDKVASPAAGKRFFDAAGHEDKTWAPQEGLFHESPERAVVPRPLRGHGIVDLGTFLTRQTGEDPDFLNLLQDIGASG